MTRALKLPFLMIKVLLRRVCLILHYLIYELEREYLEDIDKKEEEGYDLGMRKINQRTNEPNEEAL